MASFLSRSPKAGKDGDVPFRQGICLSGVPKARKVGDDPFWRKFCLRGFLRLGRSETILSSKDSKVS